MKRISGLTLLFLFIPALALAQPTTTFTADTTIGCGDFSYEGHRLVVDGPWTLTVDCAHSFTSLTLTNGAILTHSPGPANGLDLIIDTGVEVDATSSIDVSGLGHAAGSGPGAGTVVAGSGGGAAHGGNGGVHLGINSVTSYAYGDPQLPATPGSGGAIAASGALGGAGGGIIRIQIGGLFRLSGILAADGAPGESILLGKGGGGGAGGSVDISAADFEIAPSAILRANGGDAPVQAGGGAGGRIALRYTGGATPTSINFPIEARGGTGFQAGGAGSVLTEALDGTTGKNLTFDNGGIIGAQSSVESLLVPSLEVYVRGGAVLGTTPQVALILEANTLLVSSDGAIDASGMGNPADTGAGAGAAAAGGGYGGEGGMSASGALGGSHHGGLEDLLNFGSGGGSDGSAVGGAGGGRILLSVGPGFCTVSGDIIANGEDRLNGAGAGSGGSINIQMDTGHLAGSGNLSARGGDSIGGTGGGGGGGRILVRMSPFYQQTGYWDGNFIAHGGDGAERGGAGSALVLDYLGVAEELYFDNGGAAGANSPMPASWIEPEVDLDVLQGARLVAESGSVLEIECYSVTVDSMSEISMDGRGHLANGGPGKGIAGGGGAHGGDGSVSVVGGAGGIAYGDPYLPLTSGSGGGYTVGGKGGGVIDLRCTSLTLDGVLSCDGTGGTESGGLYGGGGAGGAVLVRPQLMYGAGILRANGGDGATAAPDSIAGGGGGGGRVALVAEFLDAFGCTQRWEGTLEARGGHGWDDYVSVPEPDTRGYAGAGSTYLEFTDKNISNIEADPYLSELTYDNGIAAYNAMTTLPENLEVPGNLYLRLGATLTSPPLQPMILGVKGSMYVEHWSSGIDLSGKGHGPGEGPGAGTSDAAFGGGAGHGGLGGPSSSGAVGGSIYGDGSAPLLFGSGGGNGGSSRGGYGGGALVLGVQDSLVMYGYLHADGTGGEFDGNSAAGGGSGGSMHITAGAFGGDHGFLVMGGSGSNQTYAQCGTGVGGPGAGGRVRIATVADSTSYIPNSTIRGGRPGGCFQGFESEAEDGTVETMIVTAVRPDSELPMMGGAPMAVAPNPFNPRTEIFFSLRASDSVRLRIHDARGKLVRELLAGETLDAGPHRIRWDGTDRNGRGVASGVYWFRLQGREGDGVVKGVLVR